MHQKYKKSPVIIIHEGAVFWLIYVLSQIRLSNPAMPIFLIGDKKALRCIPEGVTGIDIKAHSGEADHFTEIYRDQHKSFNSFWFENLCFRRSFILADFLQKYQYESCWHIDSDNMIYTDLNQELMTFPDDCKFSANGDGRILSPHNSFWTLDKLLEFNQFTMKSFTPGTEEFLAIERYWTDWKKENSAGGISDMITLTFFAEKNQESFYFMGDTDHGAWNVNICTSFPNQKQAQLFFKQKECRKENGEFFFYGKKMLNIHCQGFTKRFVSKFYTGNNKFLLFLKTLRFRPRRIAAYIYHVILKF